LRDLEVDDGAYASWAASLNPGWWSWATRCGKAPERTSFRSSRSTGAR